MLTDDFGEGASKSTGTRDVQAEVNAAIEAAVKTVRQELANKKLAQVSAETVDLPTTNTIMTQPTAQLTNQTTATTAAQNTTRTIRPSTWKETQKQLSNKGITPVTVNTPRQRYMMSEDPVWKATQRKLAKKNIVPVVKKFEDAPKASTPTMDDFLRGFNEEDEIKSTQVKRDPSFWDLTINSFNRGYNNAALGQEAWKSMYGLENDLDRYNQILSSDEYSFETDDLWEMIISGAAQQFGQWSRQMTDPDTLAMAAGAGGAAFLAGQAGPQVLVPEEIFTVPAAFAAGLTAGSAKTALEVEGGLAYLEMIDNGVSEETARAIATGVGAVNAGLEFLQLDELLKAYKVLDKVGADDSLLKIVIRELTDRGVDIATETGQELLQETTTIAGTQLGSKLDTGEWAYNFGEVTGRLRNTAKESALTFGLTNIPSTFYNIDTQNRNRLAAQGETRLRTGEMPTDAQLSAMNMSKSEALGAMVMLSLDQSDDAVITDGSHLEDGQLKPNATYKTGEHDYFYETSESGLIDHVYVGNLQFKTHDGRLMHNPNTYGKLEGDHAGHLIGDRFGGSPELDNLVSQAKSVNMVEYLGIENQWATALKKGQKVSVDIKIGYDSGGIRPDFFEISYTIDGDIFYRKINNH